VSLHESRPLPLPIAAYYSRKGDGKGTDEVGAGLRSKPQARGHFHRVCAPAVMPPRHQVLEKETKNLATFRHSTRRGEGKKRGRKERKGEERERERGREGKRGREERKRRGGTERERRERSEREKGERGREKGEEK